MAGQVFSIPQEQGTQKTLSASGRCQSELLTDWARAQLILQGGEGGAKRPLGWEQKGEVGEQRQTLQRSGCLCADNVTDSPGSTL